jgi:hypothetical protein
MDIIATVCPVVKGARKLFSGNKTSAKQTHDWLSHAFFIY